MLPTGKVETVRAVGRISRKMLERRFVIGARPALRPLRILAPFTITGAVISFMAEHPADMLMVTSRLYFYRSRIRLSQKKPILLEWA